MSYAYEELDPIDERSSGTYECTLHDQAGDAITTARLTSLKIKLVERTLGTVINSRNEQSVLNVNGGALSALGVFTWTFGPLDTAIIGTGNPAVEEHLAIFSLKGDSGALERNWAVLMRINNIPHIPFA